MGKGHFPVDKLQSIQTPFYYYDTDLLRDTLRAINKETEKHEGYIVHYAVKANANPKVLNVICQAGLGADCVSGGEIEAAIKANANPRLLRIIREAGLGADCVSGGEIEASVKAGFPASKIVYAGVGKSDWEINLGLDNDIFCFNVESIPELEVINELAAAKGKVARVAFRLNPNVGAHTHANITTGLAENKFGIAMRDMVTVIRKAEELANVKFVGLHFHIGSQILDMGDFQALCNRVNELQDELERHRIRVEHINVGGGLGIDYEHPNRLPIPDFKAYFDTYAKKLKLRNGQTLHFELGRAVVAQCGSLITRTLYIKEGATKKFAIVDAGFPDLIRPALYQAYHKIENITSEEPKQPYDVVGPICESTDVFAKQIDLNEARRGDLMAIRSAGAYGEIMASQYNCRKLPIGYMSDEI